MSVAIVGSALAIAINLATEYKDAWWPWLAVGFLTVASGLMTYLLGSQRKADEPIRTAQNYLSGSTTGDVAQANDIDGDIIFGGSRRGEANPLTDSED